MDTIQQLKMAAKAKRSLSHLSDLKITQLLEIIAQETELRALDILQANAKDLENISIEDPKYDRLLLNMDRILSISQSLRKVAQMASPEGIDLETYLHPKGMTMTKRTVPFGVIGVIYEARPNVSFDVFALCFKSKNVCVLKGSSDAKKSNQIIVNLIQDVLKNNGLNPALCTLLDDARSNTDVLLKARSEVDLIIPRGGQLLINYVRENSLIPTIETGAGVCHVYFDKDGDVKKGKPIIYNAKTRRVSVCNSLDCLIIHRDRLHDLFSLCVNMKQHNVVIYADQQAYEALDSQYPSELLKRIEEDTFGTEFLDYILAIKTVDNIDQAFDHIEKYGSKHSESIISENSVTLALFENVVDAACVYANVSTAFTDGGEFGKGAEIGISTQKMHARGPMALRELCTYKWIIEGSGQIR